MHAKQYNNEERNDHPNELKRKNAGDVALFLESTQEQNVQRIDGAVLQVIRGDITKISVHAIVNAANEVLEGGGGIDQTIHSMAGPGLAEECKLFPKDKYGARCLTGQAKLTGSHQINTCKYIVHTVGPYLDENGRTQPKLLASCYTSCLELCEANGIRTIAFPCISTGYYGYPMVDAATVAVQTVSQWLKNNNDKAMMEKVIFVAFNEMEEVVYRKMVN